MSPPTKALGDATPDPSTWIRALTRLGERLSATLQPSAAVESAAQAIVETLAPDHLLIALRHPASGDLVAAYAHQYAIRGPDDPTVRAVIQHGGRVLSQVSHASGAAERLTLPSGIRSWMAAGVPAAGQNIGAILAAHDQAERYGDAHHELLTAIATDLGLAITKTRLIELLSSGKREWEQTVDAIGEAFCVLDASGAIHRANRAFSRLVDVPVTALAGQPWVGVLPRPWVQPITQLLADAHEGIQGDVKAGERVYAVTALPLEGPEQLSVLVFDDQTETRRLHSQLIQSEKMSAMGQLIAGVAHDLNNPLASVVGFADYLADEDQEVPARLRGPLAAIRQEAERAAGIVRNLLSFARKHEGKRRAVAVGPILEATLQLVNNQLTASHVTAKLEVEPDLPPILVDPNQILQVFVNLINNAAQAIRTAGVDGAITLRAGRWLDGVAVTVADNGPGIAADIAERVFEPFFTTKPEGEGTGLGLSISQGILKEHGGRISYSEGESGGACFRVELPGGSTPPEQPAPPGRVASRALKVLVVDDEPHIQHYMQATLRAWGHSVVASGDGREALDRLHAESFDVIICDLRMPGLDGRELFERLQRESPTLANRLIFATGDTVREDVLQFLHQSGRPCLHKPFTLSELRDSLEHVGG